MKLHGVVTDALARLDDSMSEVWSYDEMMLYARDGYDRFARQSRLIFDIVVIENVPPTGNYGSDLQRHIALQHSGQVVTDKRLVFTGEGQRDSVREPLEGITSPVNSTGPAHDDQDDTILANPGGKLPDGIVDVLRVSWNRRTLMADTHENARLADPNYETTEGDPQRWLWSRDGLMAIRLMPVPTGNAVYDTPSGGPWGFITDTDDATLDIDDGGAGGYGFLVGTDGGFPNSGPWGFPVRAHPDTYNTVVEVVRLGLASSDAPLELPGVYQKYVLFYAMAEALKRDGPGQDLALAQHYMDRFTMGVERAKRMLLLRHRTRRQVMGRGAQSLGRMDFTLPSGWGEVPGQ